MWLRIARTSAAIGITIHQLLRREDPGDIGGQSGGEWDHRLIHQDSPPAHIPGVLGFIQALTTRSL